MQIGVVIYKGIKDWQIVQQVDGFGEIYLAGKYFLESEVEETAEIKEVYARIVDESTADVIIPWKKADHFGENDWVCVFAKVPAGGLYRIETCLKVQEDMPMEWTLRGDVVSHVGVGDIYVIAGQSNSAGYGKDPVYDPPELGVHIYKNSDKWDLAIHPMNDSTGTKHKVNLETCNSGHSPYLSFAKFVKRKIGYPVGLIQCALGGSPMERWNPEEIGDLYQNMIERVKVQGSKVRGVLWYQGCSDAMSDRVHDYQARFLGMVQKLREDLNDPKLPVFTYQIGRYTEANSLGTDVSWSVLREAQRQAAKEEGIYVIPTLDGMLSDCIHNSAAFNIILGERMAKLVLNINYGKSYFAYAPDLKCVGMYDIRTIRLDFEHVYDKLELFGIAVKELPFLVEDQNGENRIVDYKVSDKCSIELELERDIAGEFWVSGCYGKDPKGRIPVDYANHYPIMAFYMMKNSCLLKSPRNRALTH